MTAPSAAWGSREPSLAAVAVAFPRAAASTFKAAMALDLLGHQIKVIGDSDDWSGAFEAIVNYSHTGLALKLDLDRCIPFEWVLAIEVVE